MQLLTDDVSVSVNIGVLIVDGVIAFCAVLILVLQEQYSCYMMNRYEQYLEVSSRKPAS